MLGSTHQVKWLTSLVKTKLKAEKGWKGDIQTVEFVCFDNFDRSIGLQQTVC